MVALRGFRFRRFVAIAPLVAIAATLAILGSGTARAQSQGDVSSMSCADYLKAETASGWTQGVTGKPGMDNLPADQATRVHDFCASHPGSNARDAIQQVKSQQGK